VQRTCLTPNDFASLAAVQERLLAFERRSEQAAKPFEWKFTRDDLALLLKRLADKQHRPDSSAAESMNGVSPWLHQPQEWGLGCGP
jgi:hypothetical protein